SVLVTSVARAINAQRRRTATWAARMLLCTTILLTVQRARTERIMDGIDAKQHGRALALGIAVQLRLNHARHHLVAHRAVLDHRGFAKEAQHLAARAAEIQH